MKLFACVAVCLALACSGGKSESESESEPESESESESKPESKSKYDKDIDRICNAVKYAGAEGIENPSERAQKMAIWLKDNIETPEAMKLMQDFASVPPDRRESLLRREATKAGLDDCPMLDTAP